MADGPVVSVQGLQHSYDDVPILGGVDLTVEPGEILAILGASGAGKSTLLRAIAGFVTPQGGCIEVGGRPVFEDGRSIIATEARRLGMMFQDYALFPHMSVLENVAFGLYGRSDAETRARDLLSWVGLDGFEFRKPGTLSGGQQQRVALVRALAPEPVAIMLDEPFANLDGPMRAAVGDEVRRLLKNEGTSALLVTHDRKEALGLADRIAVMTMTPNGARVAQVGPPEELYNRPSTPEVAQLTGPVVLTDGTMQSNMVRTKYGLLISRNFMEGAVTAAIRPEQFKFVAGEGEWRVTATYFAGPGYRIVLDGPGKPLTVMTQQSPPDVGTMGRLEITGQAVVFSA